MSLREFCAQHGIPEEGITELRAHVGKAWWYHDDVFSVGGDAHVVDRPPFIGDRVCAFVAIDAPNVLHVFESVHRF